jgi:hypothetical protein
MIVILLSSIVVTNLVKRLPFVFRRVRGRRKGRGRGRDDGLEKTSPTAVKFNRGYFQGYENFDKETKALKALMRLKAVTKT